MRSLRKWFRRQWIFLRASYSMCIFTLAQDGKRPPIWAVGNNPGRFDDTHAPGAKPRVRRNHETPASTTAFPTTAIRSAHRLQRVAHNPDVDLTVSLVFEGAVCVNEDAVL